RIGPRGLGWGEVVGHPDAGVPVRDAIPSWMRKRTAQKEVCMRKGIGIVSVAIIVAALGAGSAGAASRRQLTCHGGTGFSLAVEWFNYLVGPPRPANTVRAYFTKGSGPAYLGISPGECAWADRGLAGTEPARFCMDDVLVDVYRSTYGTTR